MVSTTVAVALLMQSKNARSKAFYFIIAALSILPFIFNRSKQSYLSFSASFFAVFLILKRQLLFIPVAFILMLFMGFSYFFPQSLPAQALEVARKDSFKLSIDENVVTSADVRRITIARSFQELWKNPLIGRGTGWRGLAWYDSQIPLLLFENGIIGTGIFLWMLFKILINGFRIFTNSKDLYLRAISAGFIAVFFGVLIQSVPSPAWMITLVIEPFWFLAGIVVAIDRINSEEKRALRPEAKNEALATV